MSQHRPPQRGPGAPLDDGAQRGSGLHSRAKRVLLLSHDAELRSEVADLLLRTGTHLLKAASCEQARERLRGAAPPDLVIVDLGMPDLGGYEFRGWLKSQAALREIPVLALTGERSPGPVAVDADLSLDRAAGAPAVLEATTGLLESLADRRARAAQLAQSERLAALGVLAAGLAHEINNPLAVILMNLQMLKTDLEDPGRDPAETAQLIEDSVVAAERIRSLVSDVRLFSRSPGARSAIDPERVLRRVLEMTASTIERKAVLVTELGAIPRVTASEGELAQLFMNLLLNAAQAIDGGEVEDNEVLVRAGTGRAGAAVFEVADTGAGIPAELLDRVFEPFFTTKPVGVGTGIGLSVCHGIVAGLGGEILVSSQVGSGTRFVIELPAATSSVSPPPTSPSS